MRSSSATDSGGTSARTATRYGREQDSYHTEKEATLSFGVSGSARLLPGEASQARVPLTETAEASRRICAVFVAVKAAVIASQFHRLAERAMD